MGIIGVSLPTDEEEVAKMSGKNVSVDAKKRIYVSEWNELSEADKLHIESDGITGIAFETDQSLDVVIKSLQQHIERLKLRNENENNKLDKEVKD